MPVSEHTWRLCDSTPEAQLEEKEQREALFAALGTLSPREQHVLSLRFGLDGGEDRTLVEVGNEFGVSRERIRTIEAKALRMLRHSSRSIGLADALVSFCVRRPELPARPGVFRDVATGQSLSIKDFRESDTWDGPQRLNVVRKLPEKPLVEVYCKRCGERLVLREERVTELNTDPKASSWHWNFKRLQGCEGTYGVRSRQREHDRGRGSIWITE